MVRIDKFIRHRKLLVRSNKHYYCAADCPSLKVAQILQYSCSYNVTTLRKHAINFHLNILLYLIKLRSDKDMRYIRKY
jgi:hypothetical protein